ncbi:MAG: peptidylprolyl isomerase [Nitrospirae bacterium]|nr:peptidylprolyl isomerase [Nitrospirota bacterium]
MKKTGLFCLTIIFIMLGAVAATAAEDTVLGKIGDTTITLSDLNRVIGYYSPDQQVAIKSSPENRLKLLRKLMQERILTADAKKQGIDKDPAVREQVEVLVNNLLAAELIKREVADKISVSDSEALIYHQLHKEDFKDPGTVRARHILVKTGRGANAEIRQSAREKAESLLKRIRAGEDFAKVAEEASDDKGSSAKGGDLGFIPKGKMAPEFEKAAYQLKPGDVSDIVETRFGYHIIKCEEMRAQGILPFEEVKTGIKEKILKETTMNKVKEYVEKRMAEEKVEIYPERLPK